MSTRRIILSLVLLFFVWRVIILDFAISASHLLPFSNSFPYANLINSLYPYPNFLIRFANFDGVHYLTIMRDGYSDTLGIQAFFPVFPLLLRLLYTLPGLDHRIFPLGLIANNLVFLTALFTLYCLIRRDFSEKVALGSIFTLLLFPTSFYFGSLYTEPLFFLLVILSFWFAGEQRWGVAVLCTAIATATRIVGIFLVPALMMEFYLSELPAGVRVRTLRDLRHLSFWKRIFHACVEITKKNWKTLLLLSLGASGLLLYMAHLWYRYDDPILFANVQAGFGAGRSTQAVIYPQVVWRALKILATNTLNLRYLTSLQEFLAGTLGLLGILWAGKRVRLSWTIFALACFFFPPLSGNFSSMSRYLLVCFPLFVLGGLMYEKYPKITFLFWTISFLLLGINTILFIQGYWVA